MNANHTRHNPDAPDDGLIKGWGTFWFAPTRPTSLNAVRIGAGLLFLFWLLPFAGHLDSLFGSQGWLDRTGYEKGVERPQLTDEQKASIPEEEQQGPLKPMLSSWSLIYLKFINGNPQMLLGLYLASLLVFTLFTLGIASRLTAVLSWVAVVSFTSNPALIYDGDSYLLVLAFYLMVGYVLLGQRTINLSLPARLFGTLDSSVFARFFSRKEARPSIGANLAVRLLQVHFAIIMVTSGLHKLQFGDWWGGYALWYPLYPVGQATLDQAKAHAGDRDLYFFCLSGAAYAALFWQIGFPLFAFRRRWLPVVLVGGVIGWLADSFLYELPLMGPALFLCCLSFVTAEQWQTVFGFLANLPGLSWLKRPEPMAEPEEKAEVPSLEKEEASDYITVGHR